MSNSCIYINEKSSLINNYKKELNKEISDDSVRQILQRELTAIQKKFDIPIVNIQTEELYPEAAYRLKESLGLNSIYFEDEKTTQKYNEAREKALKGEDPQNDLVTANTVSIKTDNGEYITNIRPAETKTKQTQVVEALRLMQTISREQLGGAKGIIFDRIYSRRLEKTSPSRLIYGSSQNIKEFQISLKIGNEVDALFRDLFEDTDAVLNNKNNYPMFSSQIIEELATSIKEFKANYPNAVFIAKDLAMRSIVQYSSQGRANVVGEPDLIIVKEDGSIEIIDFKTFKNKEYIDPDNRREAYNRYDNYSRQLTIYSSMLGNQIGMTNVPITTKILGIQVNYIDPKSKDEGYYTETENGVIYTSVAEDGSETSINVILDTKSTTNTDLGFIFNVQMPKEIIPVELYPQDVNTFTTVEEAMEWYESKEKEKSQTAQNIARNSYEFLLGHTVSRSVLNTEITFISKYFSTIIDDLVALASMDPQSENYSDELEYFSEFFGISKEEFESKYIKIFNQQFTNKASNLRTTIINSLGFKNILNAIKENLYGGITDPVKQSIYNNFNLMILLAESKIKYYEQLSKTGLDNSLAEVLNFMDESIRREFENKEESSRESWQVAAQHLSSRSSLSKNIRRILGKIIKKDANGNAILDASNDYRAVYVNEDEVFTTISNWLQGCKNGDDMIDMLNSHRNDTETDGSLAAYWIDPLIEEIRNEPVKSMFYQNFKKEAKHYSSIVWIRKNGVPTLVVKMINTSNMYEHIYNEFAYNILKARDQSDTYFLKPGRIDNIQNKLNNINQILSKISPNKTDTLEEGDINTITVDLVGILNDLGIKGYIGNGSGIANKLRTQSGIQEIKTAINAIKGMLGQVSKIKSHSNINNISDLESNSYIKTFVSTIASTIRSEVEACCYENGKLYYAFVPPSYMGEMIQDLKGNFGRTSDQDYKAFIDKEFNNDFFPLEDNLINQYFWINALYHKSLYRSELDFKTQIHFDKVNYRDQDPATYAMSLMLEFYNNGDKNYAWYRVPIVSNKPAAEFIRFRKLGNQEILGSLKVLAHRELKRIKTVLYRWANDQEEIQNLDIKLEDLSPEEKAKYKEIKDKIKNKNLGIKDLKTLKSVLTKSGASFKFLPILNNILFSEQDNYNTLNGKTIDTSNALNTIINFINDTELDTIITNKVFEDLILDSLNREVQNELEQLKKLGLSEIEESKNQEGTTIYKYKKLSSLGLNATINKEALENNLKKFITEYIYNEVFATANIIMLSASDLALYKNMEDFQKRYAQVHSNALRLNTTATFINERNEEVRYSDGKHRCIYIADKISLSNTISAIESIFDRQIAKTSDEGEKASLTAAKNRMVKELKKVNTTDGQAFTCPTGFRKKRGMAGRWTEADQTAYDHIINYDKESGAHVSNMMVSWSVQKPFQYSQIFKKSGVSGKGVLESLKIGVQYKNSEHVLVIADAILRSQNETSELTALFDFMESTHKDKNGNYVPYGIDTIQFENSVKIGGMGVLNIYNKDGSVKSKEEILQVLEVAKRRDDGTYDERYVHETPFSDWGIQQEVPDHLMDHYQAIGSQVRILGISDLYSEDRATQKYYKDLQSKYQNANAQNIYLSLEELKEELHLNGTRAQQMQALSELLTDEIIRNLERYGTDLLIAVSLNSQGEFNIPLNDFLNSVRIQQLLNSIIKSRIYKQKIAGGPTVQVSTFGYSDNCNIRFKDEKGNILLSKTEYLKENPEATIDDFKAYLKENAATLAYMEAFVSFPSEQIRKDMTRNDGSIMSIEEALSRGILLEDQLKAIGYRIPTEDKYSMMPIKIVGFLPSMTEAIILPEELPAITGSDFDIDKIYLMLKEVSLNKNPFNYSLAKEFLENVVKKNTNNKDMIALIPKVLKSFSEDLKGGLNYALNNLNRDIAVEDALFRMMTHPGAKRFFSRYTELSKKEAKNTKEQRKITRSINNNTIIDTQYEVLTSTSAALQLLNPGTFESLITMSNKISAWENTDINSLNPLTPSTQRYLHSQNMTAAKLIGIFANHNVSHSFVSMQDITLENLNHSFKIGSTSINKFSKIDNIKNNYGQYVSKVIAEFLNASVDAVKNPVLNRMNVNTTTAGVAMLMARLGCDIDTICTFLSSPILKEVVSEYEIIKGTKDYIPLTDVISNKANIIINDNFKVTDIEISLEELENTIKQGKTSNNSVSDTDKKILQIFYALYDMTSDLTELVHCTKYNSINNAVGPNISNTIVNNDRVDAFISRAENGKTIFNIQAGKIISNSAILEAFYNSSYGNGGLAKRLMGSYFPHWKIMDQIKETIESKIKGRLKAEDIDDIVSDLMLCLYQKELISNDSKLTYENYIKDFPVVIDKYKKRAEFVLNEFLKGINAEALEGKANMTFLTTHFNNISNNTKDNIQADWEELCNVEIDIEGSPFKGKNLGESLFTYFILRSGFHYSPTTPTHLASSRMKINNSLYRQTLNVNFKELESLFVEFIDLYFRNNVNNRKFVSKFKPSGSTNVQINGNKIEVKVDKYSEAVNNKENYYKLKTEKTENDKDTFVNYIIYNDKLYRLNSAIGDRGNYTLVYEEVSPLGIKNKFKEYVSNKDSVFKNIQEQKSAVEVEEKGVDESDFEGEGSKQSSNNIGSSSQASNNLNASQIKALSSVLEEGDVC